MEGVKLSIRDCKTNSGLRPTIFRGSNWMQPTRLMYARMPLLPWRQCRGHRPWWWSRNRRACRLVSVIISIQTHDPDLYSLYRSWFSPWSIFSRIKSLHDPRARIDERFTRWSSRMRKTPTQCVPFQLSPFRSIFEQDIHIVKQRHGLWEGRDCLRIGMTTYINLYFKSWMLYPWKKTLNLLLGLREKRIALPFSCPMLRIKH